MFARLWIGCWWNVSPGNRSFLDRCRLDHCALPGATTLTQPVQQEKEGHNQDQWQNTRGRDASAATGKQVDAGPRRVELRVVVGSKREGVDRSSPGQVAGDGRPGLAVVGTTEDANIGRNVQRDDVGTAEIEQDSVNTGA